MVTVSCCRGCRGAEKHHTDAKRIAPQEGLLVTNVERRDTGRGVCETRQVIESGGQKDYYYYDYYYDMGPVTSTTRNDNNEE